MRPECGGQFVGVLNELHESVAIIDLHFEQSKGCKPQKARDFDS